MLRCFLFKQPLSPSSSPAVAAPHGNIAAASAAATTHAQQQQHEASSGGGVGGSSLLTPATQQTIRRVVAAGLAVGAGVGTAARPQSSIRRMQPTTDVHRLEVGVAQGGKGGARAVA